MHGIIIAICVAALASINMSRIYHYIRGQSVLKLYVIFNMLQICDRLFCSFGEDIMEALWLSFRISRLSLLFHTIISIIYVFVHSLVLFAEVITLNVSVNSNNSSLFVLLVSNNFVELKGSVFKRFDPANLLQISCADITERFQLAIFILLLLAQNLSHIGLAYAHDWVQHAQWVMALVFGSECLVDWVKHGFITKFNLISPTIYRQFKAILCGDYAQHHAARNSTSSSNPPDYSYQSVARRLGFSSLPIVVLVLRVLVHTYLLSYSSTWIKLSMAAVGFACLAAAKLLLTIVLLGHSVKTLTKKNIQMEQQQQQQQQQQKTTAT